jgi:hypothetical protein
MVWNDLSPSGGKMRTALIFFLLASPAVAQEMAATTDPLSACGPANVKFDVKPDQSEAPSGPPSGKALVYVIEDKGQVACLGGCPTIRIGLDGSWIGANQGNTHFSFSVLPGEHHLCSNWQSSLKRFSSLHSLANFTAKAGQVYYFRTRLLDADKSFIYLDLDPVNSDEGRYLVAASSLVSSQPKK